MNHLFSNLRVMNEIQPALKRSNPTRRYDGFTLVELLVTIAIIGILVGMIVGVAGYASRKSADSQALADITMIYQIMDEYRAVFGSYPIFPGANPTMEDMPTAVRDAIIDEDGRIRADEIPVIDPWGRAYRYSAIRKDNNTPAYGLDVWSLGALENDDSDNVRLRQ